MDTLKKMKGGKAAGIDSIVVEMLKRIGIRKINCLLRIFNRCKETGIVPDDLKEVCIVPICKRKGD